MIKTDLRNPKALLISSSNHDFQKAMPVGLMVIATLLDTNYNIKSNILELPLDDDDIGVFVTTAFKGDEFFVGFSTMCNTLPRSLAIAKEVKQRFSRIPIVFGGPQATAVWGSLFDRYNFIDFIVLGEAEQTLDTLVNMLIDENSAPNNSIVTRKYIPVVPTLPITPSDQLLSVDYSLYPIADGDGGVSIEIGRGCPYECSFCSTQSFFQRKYRLKTPQKIASEISEAVKTLKIDCVDFIHDMFTANRTMVLSICNELIARGLNVKWGCSTRTDNLDELLLDKMVESGCHDIFFGIETASQRMQKQIGKNLNVKHAIKILQATHDRRVQVTASFIIGFPDETPDDLAETLNMILLLRSWKPRIRSAQVHLLAPIPGTTLTQVYHDRLLYDGHFTDLCSVNCLSEWENDQILFFPHIFSSFYYFQTKAISRSVYLYIQQIIFWGNRFEEYFDILYRLLDIRCGLLLLEWANKREPNPRISKNCKIGKLLQWLADELFLLAEWVPISPPNCNLLKDAIAFGFWKSYIAQNNPEEVFISTYDYLAPNISNIFSNNITGNFIYSIDIPTKKIRRISLNDEVLAFIK